MLLSLSRVFTRLILKRYVANSHPHLTDGGAEEQSGPVPRPRSCRTQEVGFRVDRYISALL